MRPFCRMGAYRSRYVISSRFGGSPGFRMLFHRRLSSGRALLFKGGMLFLSISSMVHEGLPPCSTRGGDFDSVLLFLIAIYRLEKFFLKKMAKVLDET